MRNGNNVCNCNATRPVILILMRIIFNSISFVFIPIAHRNVKNDANKMLFTLVN